MKDGKSFEARSQNLRSRRSIHSEARTGTIPRVRSMHGIFVAAGPAFKRGVVVQRFENVHIYNALAAVLKITPAPNDGDPVVARTLLR